MPAVHSAVLPAVAIAAAAVWFIPRGPADAVAREPVPARMAAEPAPVGVTAAVDTAVFAGGCFWGVEAVFESLEGVSDAVSGYSGGSDQSPSYEEVSSGRTGHAEAVRVVYDPARISYDQLLQVFFTVAHDPTQLDRQGPDVGTQYRSAVFYRNPSQREAVERYIAKLGQAKVWPGKIVTEVSALRDFHPAEEYHQNYLVRHPTQPYIVVNDLPKLEQLRKRYPELVRRTS
ncbi:MAG TPA: peptide-methionine (S)-S-oxide reductase MsrA [Gemmatimonadales bacterium]|nr:peptide-methionine (S)-S-oxide reductase MsrA [Gemmatimonadales bacterium]